ncbi:transformation/transcription domain-associated protein [Nematocida displodere]|uniref:Transformation/transcription domain-associated protein n=1 Tax=Nematocida displodere TaxID=1805483 RepID=A0A177EBX9_9MICR|nr:transformation/transcription domain-associated protein [Nematocida displodere]
MKINSINNKSLSIQKRIDQFYQWRTTEGFLEYIQNEKSISEDVFPFLEDALSQPSPEDKRKSMSILIRIRITQALPLSLVEKIVASIEEGSLSNVSLGVRCLIEIVKKIALPGELTQRILSSIRLFFQRLGQVLEEGLTSTDQNTSNTIRKSLLLSSEPIILLLVLVQVSREEVAEHSIDLLHSLRTFSLFFIQHPKESQHHLINENIKLQCITTLTQIVSLFMQLLKSENQEIHQISRFVPELSIFLLGFCPDDAISIKKDIYHQLSILKTEKKRVFATYSEAILKEGILLRPKNPILKLLGLTLSTEFLILFRDSTHRHLSLKVCREASKILLESEDHTLNKLCANVLVQINDTIIGDNISVGEKGFFIRMNYLSFVSAFKKYGKIPVTEETKNVLRSVIRGMKNTMHYFSLFQNIPSNAIVFSLKCFTPCEIATLSGILGLSLELFMSFDLEKRTDIIILCEFLLIFFYLDSSLFHRVVLDNVKVLFKLTKENAQMFTIWRQFLAYAGVARKFALIVIDELMKTIHDYKDSEFIVQGFKEIFSSFAVHTGEIESVVSANLQRLFELCLVTEERLLYTLRIVKELFRAASKEKLESLHKEMALILPMFFSRLEKIERIYPHKEEYVELCLTIPVKISVLLPFLGQMSKSLLMALRMKNRLSVLAMETLETCVDNLNSEFLLTYLGEHIDKILVALVDLVHHEDTSVMGIKLLGKLAGRAGTSHSPSLPSSAPAASSNTSPAHMWLHFPSSSVSPVAVPIDTVLLAAGKIIEGKKEGSKSECVDLVGHFFHQFFLWGDISEEIAIRWARGLEVVNLSDFEELHRIVNKGELYPSESDLLHSDYLSSTDTVCSLICSLFVCASEGRVPFGNSSVIECLALGDGSEDGSPQISSPSTSVTEPSPPAVVAAKNLLNSVFSFITVVKVLELVNFEEFQRRIKIDVSIFIEMLVKAFGDERTEGVAQEVLSTMYRISLNICGTKEKTSQMTLFYSILHAFCTTCYSYDDTMKMCGVKGIIYITQTLDIGKDWLLYQEIRIVKALFASLISSRYNNTEVVRESIFYILRTTHDPATETSPTTSDLFTQLIFCFTQELSHPHAKVRQVSQECLDYSAELFGSDIASFLQPLKEKILLQVLSKPLRALPLGMQIGNMDIMAYLFGLRPPLLKIDERIERFIGEAFRIISSPNSTLKLRVSSVKLFVSAAISPEFTSSQFLLKISQVLIKGLFSKEVEVVDVCRDGLRQMYIQRKETPRDILQTWLQPIVGSFNQKKVTIQIITGLSYLQELDSHIFKQGLAINLLDMLKQGVTDCDVDEATDLCFTIFSKTAIPADGEFVSTATALYVHCFKTAHTKKISEGFKAFAESKPGAVSVLFRMANDDDVAYFILLSAMREKPSIRTLGQSLVLSSQSTWRQFVLLECTGYAFSRAEAEKALDTWRESIGDEEFEKLLYKWSLSSPSAMLAYYAAEEHRTAPVVKPTENIHRIRSVFGELLKTGDIFSVPEKVQRRIVQALGETLPSMATLCINGPSEWKAVVADAVVSSKKELPEEEKEFVIDYLRKVLEIPELEAADAVRISAYLVASDPNSSPDAFIPMITTHPEYAEHAISGVVSLLRRCGVEPFLESISSVLEDETLYKTHLYIILPAISKVPELFVRSGIEIDVCSAAQRLFSSGSSRLALPFFRTAMVWFGEASISGQVMGMLTASYISYYLHSKVFEPLEPGVEALPLAPESIAILPDHLSPQALAVLYATAAPGNPALAEALRPALRACFARGETLSEMEAVVPAITEVDKEFLGELFDELPDNTPAPKLAILVAGSLQTERAIEKALLVLEETLKTGSALVLADVLPLGLKLVLAQAHLAPASLLSLAQMLIRYPEVFKHPETADCVASIVQSPDISSGLKQSLLLSMEAEEFQEIRLGLVHAAYLDPSVHSGEVASSLQLLFIKGLSSGSFKIRNDFFRLFDDGVPSTLSERILYLCTFEWEMFPRGVWVPAFTRMLLSVAEVKEIHAGGFWDISDASSAASFASFPLLLSSDRSLDSARAIENTLPALVDALHSHGSTPKSLLKGTLLSLLHQTNEGSAQILKHVLASVLPRQSDKAKAAIHARAEEMLIRLGASHVPNISLSAEPIILGMYPLCSGKPQECRLLEVAQSTGAWTSVASVLEGRKECAKIFLELEEADYFLAQVRISALYPETIKALIHQQLGQVKTAQAEYEDVQAKAQSGVLLFNEDEYKIWEEQWIDCAAHLQQWDLLSEIGAATKNASLTAKAKWYTSDFSIDSEKAVFRSVIEDIPPADKAFYELFIIGKKTKETEEKLYRIVTTTIEDIARFPKLSPRQLSSVERFQIIVEMNESWQLNETDDLRRDLAGILHAWKDRVPSVWTSLSFWSMLVKWRTHVFASLWNSKTKEKALQYRGYHETAHILNLFSKTLRKHAAYPAALTNLESIYTLPNIEIADAFMKLEEHAKCYMEMEEYTAGMDLLGMTNLNYFTTAQKSGVFLLRGQLLEERGLLEEAARVYAQAAQVHPTNAKVWYKWGILSQESNPTNAVNAFMQAAAISPGQIARKSIVSVVSLMDSGNLASEMDKVFEATVGEVDAWCFIPFVLQMVAILSRTGSAMAMSALSRVARIYPQAVYFPVRNALESERKGGIENTPISELWTFLKTGFTLMCINIEGIVESLSIRLRCSAEEEFYRLLCALLSESLQQLFGKEPSESGSLSTALKKISEMIGASSLATRYKNSFDRDFSPGLLAEPLAADTIWEIAQTLLRWKGALERVMGPVPRKISMENISRTLVDFDQRNEDIEVFGQYIDITDRARQMIRIARFEPDVYIQRRGGISLRRVGIRGSNGMVYNVVLQTPSGKTARREERFIQALALINATMEKVVEIKKRSAKVSIKKIVLLNHQTRLILEEEDAECLNEILEKKLGPQKVYEFICQCRKEIEKEEGVLQPSDALDPETRLKMFIGAAEQIGDSLLFDAFAEKFTSQNDFFYFRKRVAISHGVHCLMTYVFSIGSRMPSRMYIGTHSGAMLSSDFYPSFSEKPAIEEVPFRMTPNIQKLIGRAGLEGPFLSTMYHCSMLLSTKKYLLSYIDALAREEIGPEKAERSMLMTRNKIKELTSSEDTPAKSIIRLVGNATAPERLSMMDPQWHPWL